MKAILVMGLFVISTSAFSAVYKSYDSKNSCNLYRAGQTEETTPQKGEQVVLAKNVYGFSFSDLEIDFENREASVHIITNVVLGFNSPLLKSKVTMSADHPNFTALINQLNRKLYLLEKICVSSDNKIIYAAQFEE